MLAQRRGYETTKVTTADQLFSCEKPDQTDGVNFVVISPLTFHSDTLQKENQPMMRLQKVGSSGI